MAFLEHCPNRHAEWLLAFAALVDAGPRAAALQLVDALRIGIATVRANRALRPEQAFKMLPGRILVGVDCWEEGHVSEANMALQYVKYT